MICKRKKAFIGAIVSGLATIGGGLADHFIQKNAEKKAIREKNIEDAKNKGIEQATEMTNAANNQEAIEEYKNKIVMKKGGKINSNDKYMDRVEVAKKLKCGGRKKAALGTNSNNYKYNNTKTIIESNSDNSIAGSYTNSEHMLRCGGRVRKKCGGKR